MVISPCKAWLGTIRHVSLHSQPDGKESLTCSEKTVGQSAGRLLDSLAFIAVLPYRELYRINTLSPISSIVTKNDEVEINADLNHWFKSKLKEAQYVQVAVGGFRMHKHWTRSS